MARLLQLAAFASFLSTAFAGQPRIIGGKDAEKQGFPHIVYLAKESGQLVCTGTLVSQKLVLTSSHCQWGKMAKAEVGRWDTTDDTENFEARSIVATHVYPSWDHKTLTHDILLVELDAPVEGVPVSKLHKGEFSLVEGQAIISVGYGTGSGGDPHDKLQVVELEYVSNESCMEFSGSMPSKSGTGTTTIPYSSLISNDLMCTHFSDGVPKDFCHGDSGGPLLIKNSKWRKPLEPPANSDVEHMPAWIQQSRQAATVTDTVYTQIAMASWGFDCADPDAPGIGQRIGHAWEFIRTWICRVDGDKAPQEYKCGDFLDFHAFPGVGVCDEPVAGAALPCKERSDCNTDAGECCVYDSCSCKIPNGIEKFMCVPNRD